MNGPKVCVLFTSKCSPALGKNVKFLSVTLHSTTIVEVLNGPLCYNYNPMCLSVVVVPTYVSECVASVSNKMQYHIPFCIVCAAVLSALVFLPPVLSQVFCTYIFVRAAKLGFGICDQKCVSGRHSYMKDLCSTTCALYVACWLFNVSHTLSNYVRSSLVHSHLIINPNSSMPLCLYMLHERQLATTVLASL